MIKEISNRTVETLYHVVATLHVEQRRPVKVLQGVGQHRLAIQVLAALGHHNVLAMFPLCSGTRRHDHCAVVRSADVGQHNWSIIPIHHISIDLVQDSGLSSRLFHDLFQWIAGECCVTQPVEVSKHDNTSMWMLSCGCVQTVQDVHRHLPIIGWWWVVYSADDDVGQASRHPGPSVQHPQCLDVGRFERDESLTWNVMTHKYRHTAAPSSVLPVVAVDDVARNVQNFTRHWIIKKRFSDARNVNTVFMQDSR